MGFRFRASEDPPCLHSSPPPPPLPLPSVYSSDFFAVQAMKYGYNGLEGPMHPHSSLEALQRELDEERIKEEILARRIAQKRMVEEQVRREIEIERELMMIERFQVERYYEPSRMIVGPEEKFGPDPVRRNVGFEERSPLGGSAYFEVGNSASDSKTFDEVKFPNQKFSGVKRKATATISGMNSIKFPQPLQNDWSCALCQVSVTSEEGLNDHLKGKKHLAMAAQLSSDKKPAVAKNSTSSSNCESSSSTPKMAARKNKGKKRAGKRKGKGIVSIEANGKTYEVVESGALLWCSLCKIQCSCRENMATHLKGKKHMLEELREDEKLKEVVKMEAVVEGTKICSDEMIKVEQ